MLGDDLEDDFIPDSDFAIVSGEDGHSWEDDEGSEEFHGIGETNIRPSIQSNELRPKKRKRRDDRKEGKAKKRKRLTLGEADAQPLVTCPSPVDAAHYLSTQQAKAFPKLTVLELEDRRIPVSCIADTTSYLGSRTLEDIGEFINHNFPQLMTRLGQNPRNNGAPTLMFVAGAALRVADVTRVMRRYRGEKGGEIAKLFARHFKLQDHVTYLKRTKVGVAVGTPARLEQLIEAEALVFTALTHIFIDTSHRDAKKRTIMDIPETREGVFCLLGAEKVRAAFASGKTQLVLF